MKVNLGWEIMFPGNLHGQKCKNNTSFIQNSMKTCNEFNGYN